MTLTFLGKMFAVLFALFYWGAVRAASGLLFQILGVLAGCFLLDFWKAAGAGGERTGGEHGKFVFEEGEPVNIPALGINNRVFPRGEYLLSKIGRYVRGPLGLFALRKKAKGEGVLIITPKIRPVDSPAAGGLRPVMGGGGQGSSPSRSGGAFRSIRAYNPGDPITRIHWPASAKGLGLMTKEFEEERAGYVAIWLDAGGGGGADYLDEACRLGGSLAFSALDKKHAVEFVIWGEGRAADSEHLPGIDEILEKLALVKVKPETVFLEKAERIAGKFSFFSSHVFILLSPKGESARLANKLSSRNKTVTVYLPGGPAAGEDVSLNGIKAPAGVLEYPGLSS